MSLPDCERAAIRQLLDRRRTATLASLGETGPEASLAPFAIHGAELLLHLSGLARHRRNLEREARLGLLIAAAEHETESPLALPRLSLSGRIAAIDTADLPAARAAYLARIPEAEPLFAFADFSLFSLVADDIYWVGGFGAARRISPADWRELVA